MDKNLHKYLQNMLSHNRCRTSNLLQRLAKISFAILKLNALNLLGQKGNRIQLL